MIVWDKQWKVRRGSEEYEAQSYPRVNSEHIPVNPRVTLKSVNPDFTGLIRKSVLCTMYFDLLSDQILR